MNDVTEVTVYTDGACIGNPGPGGYAAILISGKKRKEIVGGYRLTTNNRMEILAAVLALEALKWSSRVTVHRDSRYLVDAVTKGWAERWRDNGWKRNAKEEAVNADLWERLLILCEKHEVEFVWVQGHAGHPENERCDLLSVAAARAEGLPADIGYEERQAKQKARETAQRSLFEE
ncbi:MAG TPA: ribonuclease HI [Gemmataceae bacterium]|jgi:ribonuclease HI